MRIAFLGSPSAAVPSLRALVTAGHDVALVVSGPDKRRGRGGARTPTPVKSAALELGLEVTDDLDAVLGAGVELGVVVAYGRIIPESLLVQVPMVNLHFSLLPRWRGAAPVERAILAGDEVTGVCVMDVAVGLDTGDVHAVSEVPIDDRITAGELTQQLADLGAGVLVDAIGSGLNQGEAQAVDGITYARKITTEDRRLDWTLPAQQLQRVVRIGGAWTTIGSDRLKVLSAREYTSGHDADGLPGLAQESGDVGAGSGSSVVSGTRAVPGTVHGVTVACGEATSIVLEVVQPQGKSPMDAAAWVNGARPDGQVLGVAAEQAATESTADPVPQPRHVPEPGVVPEPEQGRAEESDQDG